MNRGKTACLFGGQGLQYIGMGKDYYDVDEDCRQIFKTASDVMGYDMAELCFDGQAEQYEEEIYSLPVMLTIDLCAFTLAVKRGLAFQAVAGFSLGEYATLVAAQVVSLPDAFELVKNLVLASESGFKREGTYGMAAVNTTAEMCESMCDSIRDGYVRVANYNSIRQVTIAGDGKGLQAFAEKAAVHTIKVIPIKVNFPYHSVLMEPAARVYQNEIRSIAFSDAVIPIYMNATGEIETNGNVIKAHVVRQLHSPVLWTKTMKNMHAAGFEHYVECGLNSVLCRMITETLGIDRSKTMFLRTS